MMATSQKVIYISANGQTKPMKLAETKAAEELVAMLREGDVEVEASDYGGFEKVGGLPRSLSTDNRQITTEAGDVMLYQGRNIVIFYGSNSWSYTPLGKIECQTASEIREWLSGSSVKIKLSVTDISGIGEIANGEERIMTVHSLDGRKIELCGKSLTSLPKGIYIVNGKKLAVK